jgi:hypothetical protein
MSCSVSLIFSRRQKTISSKAAKHLVQNLFHIARCRSKISRSVASAV